MAIDTRVTPIITTTPLAESPEFQELEDIINAFSQGSKPWWYDSVMSAPTTDIMLQPIDAIADTPYTNLKLANGSAAPGISFTEEELKDPFLYLIYNAGTDTWVKKTSGVTGNFANRETQNIVEKVTGVDNIFIRPNAKENMAYDPSTGVLGPLTGRLAYEIKGAPGDTYVVSGNGPILGYATFGYNGNFSTYIVPTANPDGTFTIPLPTGAGSNIYSVGVNLMNDGQFDRDIIIQKGTSYNEEIKVKVSELDKPVATYDELDKNFRPGINLIDKTLIQYGKTKDGTGALVDSDQATVQLTEVPNPGAYSLYGSQNVAVRVRIGSTWSSPPLTRVNDFFLFNITADMAEVWIIVAGDRSQWDNAETVMLVKGLPVQYAPYSNGYNTEAFYKTGGVRTIGGLFERPKNMAFGFKYFDTDLKDLLTYTSFKDWVGTEGYKYTEPVGKIYEWKFDGGSLEADNIGMYGGLSATSETYAPNNSYRINAPLNTQYYGFLRMRDAGIHVFEYGYEVLELTLNRIGAGNFAQVGLLYEGATLSRRVDALSVLTGNAIYLRDGNGTSTNSQNTSYTFNLGTMTGRKFRIINEYYGGGRFVSVWDITTTETFICKLPAVYVNGYSNRPNNRRFGIAINDADVTISKFEVYNMEPKRSKCIVIGDSITATRVATNYLLGYAKMFTNWYGPGAFIHAGGSNTAEDLLNSIEDTINQRPDVVVVAIGINDCTLDKPNRKTDYKKLVEKLEEAGIRVVLTTVTPHATPAIYNLIKEFNAWIINTFGGTNTIIDFFTALSNTDQTGWNTALQGDENHPSNAGHKVLFDLLIKSESLFKNDKELIKIETGNSNALTTNTYGSLVDALGGQKYTATPGIYRKWDFLGDIATDQIVKSSAYTSGLISESYGAGQFRVNMGNVSSPAEAYLQFDGNSANTFNYTHEVLDFTLNSYGDNIASFVGILYRGITHYSRLLGHLICWSPVDSSKSNSPCLRILTKEGLGTTPWVANAQYNAIGQTSVLGPNQYRLMHSYNGHVHKAVFYRLIDGKYIETMRTEHVYGDCRNRPSNRRPAIMFSNIDVTITRFDCYNDEPYRSKIMYIGDSIQSGFACTDFNNTYSRRGTLWVGIGGTVRSGHGCTTEDFLEMLPEIVARRPERLIMALGLNDVRYGVPNYQANYQSIISQLEAVGTECVLLNLIPNNDDDIVPFNTWQQATFGATHTIIDVNTPMQDPTNPLQLNPAYHTDGTHPNDAGTLVMFETIKPYL